MNKLPISVFIITHNEEKRIEKSINSVINIADEIIVIDSGSTDNTLLISEKLGAKIIKNDWHGYEKQKIFGELQCKNQWILNIDADESLTPELVNEIQDLFSNGEPEIKLYKLKITIMHRLDKKLRFFAPTNAVIRLYHRDFGSFDKEKINMDVGLSHDSVKPLGDYQISCLKARAEHRSMISIEQTVHKGNFVSSEQAEDLFNKGRSISSFRVILEFPLSFLKTYFIRRYFIYGFNGIIDSIIFSYTRFLRVAKARELIIEKLSTNS
jgi:glycosyltransferase involved in cell wall biosynthesis